MTLKPAASAWGCALSSLAGALGVLAAMNLGWTGSARAEGWPAAVRAVYDVNFNGFNVGTFEFQSQAEQQSYTLVGNARLSILLGAFTWDGETRSFGLIVNQAPKPAAFSFDFKSSTKTGSTKIGFSDGAVTEIQHLPPPVAKSDTIPVREQHLKGVLDPLSAIMAISRANGANPCDRRVPVFDGKERFDLLLSYKSEMKVTEQQPSGQPGVAYVCRVKYLPIAGHKVDSDTRFMAASDAIEVALRPVPSAGVFVPYQITIPTIAGSATIVSRRVEIVTPGKAQIALMH
ncbi:MAG: DUF3108 domain-containing protein [Hyphomicrobiaceae bacterium]|nr:MAG: DUF3108 domain-containing protein [Hyphomicrobiaceae bacterium]